MKYRETALAILAALCASIALADDFKTINGKEYKNVTVSRVEPDGIVLKTSSGISKIHFTELPKEVQQRFNYNPDKAAEYSAEQSRAFEEAQKQQQKAMRRSEEETKKRMNNFTRHKLPLNRCKMPNRFLLRNHEVARVHQRSWTPFNHRAPYAVKRDVRKRA